MTPKQTEKLRLETAKRMDAILADIVQAGVQEYQRFSLPMKKPKKRLKSKDK